MEYDKENASKLLEVEKKIAINQKLYQQVFGTLEGKTVLDDLKKRCFVNQTTMDADPIKMGFNEGRRSIYVHIENLINKDLEKIMEQIIKGAE